MTEVSCEGARTIATPATKLRSKSLSIPNGKHYYYLVVSVLTVANRSGRQKIPLLSVTEKNWTQHRTINFKRWVGSFVALIFLFDYLTFFLGND